MTATERDAVTVADALTGDIAAARERVLDAVVARDSRALVEALTLYGSISWRMGWDAAIEEVEGIVGRVLPVPIP